MVTLLLCVLSTRSGVAAESSTTACSWFVGTVVPIPTLPVSSTVTLCDVPSYNLSKSPAPV